MRSYAWGREQVELRTSYFLKPVKNQKHKCKFTRKSLCPSFLKCNLLYNLHQNIGICSEYVFRIIIIILLKRRNMCLISPKLEIHWNQFQALLTFRHFVFGLLLSDMPSGKHFFTSIKSHWIHLQKPVTLSTDCNPYLTGTLMTKDI